MIRMRMVKSQLQYQTTSFRPVMRRASWTRELRSSNKRLLIVIMGNEMTSTK